MKQLLIPALLAIAAIVALDSPGLVDSPNQEIPVVNLPMELRQSNYTCCPRHKMNGSCVHVSWIMLLQWQNKPELAAWWKSHYKGGESYDEFCQRNNKAGIRYASTSNQNDVSFLEWAIKTRRGCIVGVGVTKVKKLGPTHMVCLVHLDSERAGILDNNDIGKIHWMPREQFLNWWQKSYSWASTPLYSPVAPLPFGG